MVAPQALAQPITQPEDLYEQENHDDLAELASGVVQYENWKFDTDTGTITDYEGPYGEKTIVVPEAILGIPVTGIASKTFYHAYGVLDLQIPVSVTQIHPEAFEQSEILRFTVAEGNPAYSSSEDGVLFNKDKTVLVRYPGWNQATDYSIPNGVTRIAAYAFSYAKNLQEIYIPDGVQEIGNSAFILCRGITTIELPSSLTLIEEQAFEYCTAFASFTIREGSSTYCVDEYGVLYNKDKTALICCPMANPVSTYTVPSSVTEIEGRAFSCCAKLTGIWVAEDNPNYSSDEYGALFDKDKTVLLQYPAANAARTYVIPRTVREIGKYAFFYNKNLITIEMPQSIVAIGEYAFYLCESLIAIRVPDGVTTIGNYAFGWCEALTAVELPDSLETIGDRAFMNCASLAAIEIPSNVTTIGTFAFDGSSRFSDVYYCGGEEAWNEISFGQSNDTLFNATVHFFRPERWTASVNVMGITTDQASGNAVVHVALQSNADIAIPGILMVALYSGDGELKDVANTAENLSALGSLETDIALDCAISDGDTVKAFYWGDAMRPYARTHTYLVPSV